MSEPTVDSVNVMIVEDEQFSLQTLTRTVEKLGSDVVLTATNGKEALDKLQETDLAVDIIICDIEMPEMDGFEFARRIRYGTIPDRKDVPILMLTGKDTEENFRKGRIHRIDGFLIKPATVEVLRSYMTTVLGVGRSRL